MVTGFVNEFVPLDAVCTTAADPAALFIMMAPPTDCDLFRLLFCGEASMLVGRAVVVLFCFTMLLLLPDGLPL